MKFKHGIQVTSADRVTNEKTVFAQDSTRGVDILFEPLDRPCMRNLHVSRARPGMTVLPTHKSFCSNLHTTIVLVLGAVRGRGDDDGDFFRSHDLHI